LLEAVIQHHHSTSDAEMWHQASYLNVFTTLVRSRS